MLRESVARSAAGLFGSALCQPVRQIYSSFGLRTRLPRSAQSALGGVKEYCGQEPDQDRDDKHGSPIVKRHHGPEIGQESYAPALIGSSTRKPAKVHCRRFSALLGTCTKVTSFCAFYVNIDNAGAIVAAEGALPQLNQHEKEYEDLLKRGIRLNPRTGYLQHPRHPDGDGLSSGHTCIDRPTLPCQMCEGTNAYLSRD